MDFLKELLGPIPLSVMGLVIFAIVFAWLISRCFRMPSDFSEKEDAREKIRLRLFDLQQDEVIEADKGGVADGSDKAAVGDEGGGDVAAASAAAAKTATKVENKR